MRGNTRNGRSHGRLIVGIVVVVLGLTAAFFAGRQEHSYTVTVTKTKVERVAKDNHEEVVYAKEADGGRIKFLNANNTMYGKYNKKEIGKQIQVGKTYKFTVKGFSAMTGVFPVLGENIVKVKAL